MTQIEILLLSLLYDKDYHGYEFEQVIEKEDLRSWIHIGFSSIYNSLNKLEKNNYIVSRLEKGNGSTNKRVYSITEESKKIVRENIFKMLSEYKRDASDFKIAFSFSYVLTKDELRKALTMHKKILNESTDKLRIEREEYLLARESKEKIKLFERSISLLETDIVWLDKCINED